MNSASKDVLTMIEDSGSGLDLAFKVNLFRNFSPASPTNCVVFFDTTNRVSDADLDNNRIFYDNIQVKVRNAGFDTAYALAKQIETYLLTQNHTTWSETYYGRIQVMSGPKPFEPNGNQSIIVTNYELTRR